MCNGWAVWEAYEVDYVEQISKNVTQVHVLGRIIWLKSMKGRDHSEDLGRDGSIILKGCEFVWLMIVPAGRLLYTR
jgi:hypothetical protein